MQLQVTCFSDTLLTNNRSSSSYNNSLKAYVTYLFSNNSYEIDVTFVSPSLLVLIKFINARGYELNELS